MQASAITSVNKTIMRSVVQQGLEGGIGPDKMLHRAPELASKEHCPFARYRVGRVLGGARPSDAMGSVPILAAVFRFLVDPYVGRCGVSRSRRRCDCRNASLLYRLGTQWRPRQSNLSCGHDRTSRRNLHSPYRKGRAIDMGAMVDANFPALWAAPTQAG